MKIIIKSIITFCLHYLSVGAISAAPGNASPEKGIAHMKATPADLLKDTTTVNPVIDTSFYRINTTYKAALTRLQQQAAALKEYVAANNFNTEHCFLVDMSIPSGKNRFFIYNLKKDSIELSSLVAHGFGSTRKNSYDAVSYTHLDVYKRQAHTWPVISTSIALLMATTFGLRRITCGSFT